MGTQKVIDKISSLKIPKDFKILLRIPCYYLPKESGIIKHFVQIFNRFKQYQFIIYDIKENKCIYKKDIQKHKNAVMQNINISEKYNGFIYSYFEEGIRKAYFYKF